MRSLCLILVFIPVGLTAQLWFKQDSSFSENPFYERLETGKGFLNRPLWYIQSEGEPKNYASINPYFDLKLSRDNTNKNLIKNGRGLMLEGQHGSFKYLSAVQETQENAYAYQRLLADSALALRGHNRTKRTNSGDFDYADFMGALQYQGAKMQYSAGYHPVKVGSGIRPAFISHLNTGFFNYQVAYKSPNKKLFIQHGQGILFDKDRLGSSQNAEAALKRFRLNWLNASYQFTKNWSAHVYTDAHKPLFSNDSALAPEVLDFMPLPLVINANGGFKRLGGEINYRINPLKLYAGAVLQQQFYGGAAYFKTFSSDLFLKAEMQINVFDGDSQNRISHFGNDLNRPYTQSNKEVLSLLYMGYKKFRLQGQINTFDGSQSNGTNVSGVLGYCVHCPSELLFHVFFEKRNFPQNERYIGIGLSNFIGIHKNAF